MRELSARNLAISLIRSKSADLADFCNNCQELTHLAIGMTHPNKKFLLTGR
jgi:hypothetical protein